MFQIRTLQDGQNSDFFSKNKNPTEGFVWKGKNMKLAGKEQKIAT